MSKHTNILDQQSNLQIRLNEAETRNGFLKEQLDEARNKYKRKELSLFKKYHRDHKSYREAIQRKHRAGKKTKPPPRKIIVVPAWLWPKRETFTRPSGQAEKRSVRYRVDLALSKSRASHLTKTGSGSDRETALPKLKTIGRRRMYLGFEPGTFFPAE